MLVRAPPETALSPEATPNVDRRRRAHGNTRNGGHVPRASEGPVRPVPDGDVGALLVLRHALPAPAVHGELPVHPARRGPARARLQRHAARVLGAPPPGFRRATHGLVDLRALYGVRLLHPV